MKALNRLIADVQGSIERGSEASRAQALSKITDLFLLGADQLTEEQIALFDTVIERFASASEVNARAKLAERSRLRPRLRAMSCASSRTTTSPSRALC